MTDKQFEKGFKLADKMDDRLFYLTVMVFFIMVGVCTK